MTPDWIGVDWGTSNVRAWAMSSTGTVLAEAVSDQGMGRLQPDQFEPVLLSLIKGWIARRPPIIACGMLGSRQGWIEAPYLATPCAPLPGGLVHAPAKDPQLDVYVIPGIKQENPADVMRLSLIHI